jgi:phage shock protein A
VALDLLALFRKLDGLMQLEAKHGAAIARLEADVMALQDRITRLETRDAVLIAEAKGAASAAATVATTSTVADLARRVGALEERSRSRRLPPPSASEDS